MENRQIKGKVISASRRIDMVGGYPDELVHILETRCPPEKTHTLVIWTKNATNLFKHDRLHQKILQYDQLYLHYTVTGMGGSFIEPVVPRMEESLQRLPQLIALVDHPRRIRFRFDPIVHFRLPDGQVYSNFPLFKQVAPRIAELGIRDVSISWMERYSKVLNRLKRAGVEALKVSASQWKEESEEILEIAYRHGLQVHGCCVPGWPRSRCIDGELLSQLHPKGWLCSTQKARGQRELCGCTESWDIGWYHACRHGCLYCYANPIEIPGNQILHKQSNFFAHRNG